MQEPKSAREVFTVAGTELLRTVERIIAEGNARRITIKDAQGRVFVDIPLTVGVFGMMLAPMWAVVGTAAAVASGYTVEVRRTSDGPEPAPPEPPAPPRADEPGPDEPAASA